MRLLHILSLKDYILQQFDQSKGYKEHCRVFPQQEHIPKAFDYFQIEVIREETKEPLKYDRLEALVDLDAVTSNLILMFLQLCLENVHVLYAPLELALLLVQGQDRL